MHIKQKTIFEDVKNTEMQIHKYVLHLALKNNVTFLSEYLVQSS